MDYFEALARTLLEAEGYWTRQSFKVNITREEKRAVANFSMPRPEIDLLAFKPGQDEVLAIEVKSYLDSDGVRLNDLMQVQDEPPATGRYKMFTCRTYRDVVFQRLAQDLCDVGMIDRPLPIRLGLVAGKVYQRAEQEVAEYLESGGYFFWGPRQVKAKIAAFANSAYENDPVVIAAKILLRDA